MTEITSHCPISNPHFYLNNMMPHFSWSHGHSDKDLLAAAAEGGHVPTSKQWNENGVICTISGLFP